MELTVLYEYDEPDDDGDYERLLKCPDCAFHTVVWTKEHIDSYKIPRHKDLRGKLCRGDGRIVGLEPLKLQARYSERFIKGLMRMVNNIEDGININHAIRAFLCNTSEQENYKIIRNDPFAEEAVSQLKNASSGGIEAVLHKYNITRIGTLGEVVNYNSGLHELPLAGYFYKRDNNASASDHNDIVFGNKTKVIIKHTGLAHELFTWPALVYPV